ASKAFRAVPAEVRKAFGSAVYAAVRAKRDELLAVLMAEGHPRRVAEWEVSGILAAAHPDVLDFYFENLEHTFSGGRERVVLRRVADGVVCINPPQNAAASCAALGVSALLPGNTLVVKAPKSTPLGVMYFYHEIVLPLCQEHGFPSGTVNLISGNTTRILREWLESPLVNDIMYFGDSRTGIRLGEECFR